MKFCYLSYIHGHVQGVYDGIVLICSMGDVDLSGRREGERGREGGKSDSKIRFEVEVELEIEPANHI